MEYCNINPVGKGNESKYCNINALGKANESKYCNINALGKANECKYCNINALGKAKFFWMVFEDLTKAVANCRNENNKDQKNLYVLELLVEAFRGFREDNSEIRTETKYVNETLCQE